MYDNIVLHRQKINSIRGIDYKNHIPEKINIIPPETIIKEWADDYKNMQESIKTLNP